MKRVKTFKRTLSLLLCLIMVFGSAPLAGLVGIDLPNITNLFAPKAEAATKNTNGYYTYEVSDGKAEITDVDASISGDITVPSSFDGYPVTSIGDDAFYNCTSLSSITIPDSVTSIGDEVFYNCTSLSSITIPGSVTSIGYKAFYDCSSLSSITIPDNVTRIGYKAFCDCTSLSSITIPDSVTSIGDYAFENTAYYNNKSNWENGVLYIGNHLIKAENTISGSYVIKDGTKTIAGSVFYNCKSLTSITIPDSVTSIGKYAFWFCTSLENVHYTGTEVEWNAIMIGDHNECLIEAQKVIRRPSRTSISYGDSIVLHVKDSRIPAGGYVVWTADNDNFSYSVSSDGTTCTISPKSSGSTVFTATVYDKDGKAVSSSSREMESKAGIWQKILGFFKALFGLIKIYPYAIENIF